MKYSCDGKDILCVNQLYEGEGSGFSFFPLSHALSNETLLGKTGDEAHLS